MHVNLTHLLTDMGHHIAGLLISIDQMYEMASHIAQKPMTDLTLSYGVCRDEALKTGSRWVPVDYPAKSKKPGIVLVLLEHDAEKKIGLNKWRAGKRVATAKQWLKDRGISGTEKIQFVTTQDPFRE